MGVVHGLRVKSPYKLLKIKDIKIENKPNEHDYLYLKAIDDSVSFNCTINASMSENPNFTFGYSNLLSERM